jgi:hypothetical protein
MLVSPALALLPTGSCQPNGQSRYRRVQLRHPALHTTAAQGAGTVLSKLRTLIRQWLDATNNCGQNKHTGWRRASDCHLVVYLIPAAFDQCVSSLHILLHSSGYCIVERTGGTFGCRRIRARLTGCSIRPQFISLGRKCVVITCDIGLNTDCGAQVCWSHAIFWSGGYQLAIMVLAHQNVGPKQKLIDIWNLTPISTFTVVIPLRVNFENWGLPVMWRIHR